MNTELIAQTEILIESDYPELDFLFSEIEPEGQEDEVSDDGLFDELLSE